MLITLIITMNKQNTNFDTKTGIHLTTFDLILHTESTENIAVV